VEAARHKRGERQLRPSTISEISEELEWGEVDLVAASGRFQGKQHTRRGCTSDATVANRRDFGWERFQLMRPFRHARPIPLIRV
jgi:hypothetical protein